MNWLFYIVIIILAWATLSGYRAGFVKTAVSMVFYLLSAGLVCIVTPYISTFLVEETPLYHYLQERCMELYIDEEAGYDYSRVSDQTQVIESYELTDMIKNMLLENNNPEIYAMLEVERFEEYISGFIARLLVNILAFFCTLILVITFLRATVFTLDIITRIPIISGINKLAGIGIGLAKGICIVWIMFTVSILLKGNQFGNAVFTQVLQNEFLLFLYNNNLLLKFLMGTVLK